MNNNAAIVVEKLADLRDWQLERWKLAEENYLALGRVERKPFKIDGLEGALQFNPARAVSTGAKIDKKAIASRPCFLCSTNRPVEQWAEEIIPGWDFLINPYPIFPLHFTIVSKLHVPQMRIPLEMVNMADKLRGMTIFFNGAKAGASAPDHLHCQAVMTSELPLMRYLEAGKPLNELPYKVEYSVITPDSEGEYNLQRLVKIAGEDKLTGIPDSDLVNAYVWFGEDGLLRVCVIPRGAHRPSFYAAAESDSGYMISPGAIDMAGILILPRFRDFKLINENDILNLYSEVALDATKR